MEIEFGFGDFWLGSAGERSFWENRGLFFVFVVVSPSTLCVLKGLENALSFRLVFRDFMRSWHCLFLT